MTENSLELVEKKKKVSYNLQDWFITIECEKSRCCNKAAYCNHSKEYIMTDIQWRYEPHRNDTVYFVICPICEAELLLKDNEIPQFIMNYWYKKRNNEITGFFIGFAFFCLCVLFFNSLLSKYKL
jgi:hypothetical protein